MWDVINNVLSVIGLISLVLTVFRGIWVFSGKNEWSDNVRVEEYPLDEDLDSMAGAYPQYYPCHPSNVTNEYATQNLFIPQGLIIRNAVLKKVKLTQRKGDVVEKYVKVAKFKQITPHSPLCLVIERTHAIPQYMIEWRVDYGGRGRYYFADNLRTGDNNMVGVEYRFGFFAKMRKIIGLP